MKAGDVVHHRPTGETWVVAAVTDDGRFFACGWPETLAQQSDAEMQESCNVLEHRDTLRRVAASRGDDGLPTSRSSWAARNLAEFEAAARNQRPPETPAAPGLTSGRPR